MNKVRELTVRSNPKHKEGFGYLTFLSYSVHGRIFIDAPGFQMFLTKKDARKLRDWLINNIDKLKDNNS